MTTEQPEALRLENIRIDGGTQPRVEIDQKVVADYADLYANGVNLPPVTVFFDGTSHWLADGFHRYWATKKIDCEVIFADVHQGTQRDAILYSAGANAAHGLRRSNADKHRAVMMLLEDEEWSQWSDREIARRCGVVHRTVSDARRSLTGENRQSESSDRKYIHNKSGKPARMNTSKIGRSSTSKRRKPKPGEIAPNARKPVRGIERLRPKTAIEIPHDPQRACRTIVSALGYDFARALASELSTYLEGASS